MTPAVRLLLLANVAVFALQATVPGFGNAFVFDPRHVLTRPWTLVTYMFLHGGLMHIAFNMLALFFFGPRIEGRIGSRPFAILYFASGISGALLSMFFSGSPIIGASGGVFGVMLAFAWYWPDERIFLWGVLPVPARVLVIGTTAMALFGGFGGAGDGVAHFAHLGGYVGAFLYLRWLERGRKKFRQLATAPAASRVPLVTPPPPPSIRRIDDSRAIDMSVVHEMNRPEVSRIVDKVAGQGLASLTEQERRFLASFVSLDDPPVRPT
ncbi:MAG: rhomboid family intramembrane serine protease [Gemmatimonadetes bacterium]|nr:rhomboid family intramembrane serine protease [Gemmatimonadota bacterium]MCC6770854.1 rhomboid family intramembrane serine protease [Gemmatimonadaceae bacterium]